MQPNRPTRRTTGIAGPRIPGVNVVRAKDTKHTLKSLWKFFKIEKKGLWLAFLLILLSGLLGLSVPFLIGKAVDAIFPGIGQVMFANLRTIVLILLSVYIFNNILSFVQDYIIAGISQRVVFDLREKMFKKLQNNVSTTISQSTVQFMSSFVNIVGSLVMMLYLSPILTLASMITIPMVFLLTKFIAKKTKLLFRQQQKSLGMLNGHIEETIAGIHVVKAFNNEEKVILEFKEQNDILRDVGVKAQTWSGFIMPLMNVINNFSFGVIAVFGGSLAVKGTITVGVIASFISYSKQFSRPLNELANTFNTLQSGLAGAERVIEILDEVEERKDAKDAILIDHIKGDVEFKNVSFEYEKGEPVLKDISFSVKGSWRNINRWSKYCRL